MNIQMGRGLQIQIRRMGSPATREDQVDIFGAADPDTIGTVAEQRQYFERWLDSLK
ncbi:hypothetical protein [Streptomyces violascens]|nr:hypothetical protein [Streptomyces violascens]